MSAARLASELRALSRAHGGRDALYESLSTSERSKLAARIIEASDEAERKAREADAKAKADLGDPVLQRELARMGVQYLLEHPEQLAPHLLGIIRRRPSLLRDEILAEATVRSWLTRCGYRRELGAGS